MYHKLLLAVLWTYTFALYPVRAQTPPCFEPACSRNLGVKFVDESKVVVPGYPLSLQETQSVPHITLTNASCMDTRTTYMAFMIDIDKLERHCTSSQLLHWYQPDLVVDNETGSLLPIPGSRKSIAAYAGPAPPARRIHRYVQLLLKQPDLYDLPEAFERYLPLTIEARSFWNMTEFVEAIGLDLPVAANYFTVSGGAPQQREVGGQWKHEL